MLIAASLLVCVIVVLYIGAPLVRAGIVNQSAVPWPIADASATILADPRDSDALAGEQDGLARELSELDFDRRMDKIDAEEFEDLRQATAARLDTVTSQLAITAPAGRDIAVGRDITKGRGTPPVPTAGVSGKSPMVNSMYLELEAEAEILITRARLRMARWECGECRRSMAAGDRFCASCGKPRPAPLR